MNALVEQVRDFLRGASSKVTAKLIADAVKATPIEVGKALDELKGLRHADRDGMNRWHITERGRLGTPPDPPPAAKKRNALLPDRGKTKIQLIVEAIGNESLTVPEIAERTKLPKEIVGQNISVSGKKYGLITDGKRGTYHLWRRANPSQVAAESESAVEADRGAIAKLHDEQEAAKPPISAGQDGEESQQVAVAAKSEPGCPGCGGHGEVWVNSSRGNGEGFYVACPFCRPIAPVDSSDKADPNAIQIGGDHYRARAIQPWDYIAANDLGFFEGNIVNDVTRWRDKGGIEDLHKARHYLDKLIEMKQAEHA